MDSRNIVITCYRSDLRLLDKVFKTKSIKEGGKTPNQHLKVPQANEKSKSKSCLTNLHLYLLSPIPALFI